jgi:hypothetical protein
VGSVIDHERTSRGRGVRRVGWKAAGMVAKEVEGKGWRASGSGGIYTYVDRSIGLLTSDSVHQTPGLRPREQTSFITDIL